MRKFIISTLLCLTYGFTVACKCDVPGTIKEEFDLTPLVVHGRVIGKTSISYAETIKLNKVDIIRNRLKEQPEKLKLFESKHIFKIELEVIESFKGVDSRKTITIYTTVNGASCGYDFKKGGEYVVYGDPISWAYFFFAELDEGGNLEQENTYWVNHCSRTSKFLKSETDELRRYKN